MTLALQDTQFVEKAPLERYVAPEKPSLIGLTRAQLADALGSIGVAEAQRKMRVQQLWHWIYFRGFTSFDEMTSVSKELRAALADRFTLARPEVVAEQVSVDGTRKWLLRLPGEVQGERPTRSNASTSLILNAAPYVFPVRLAAHLIAPSAIPVPNAWSEISLRERLWAK